MISGAKYANLCPSLVERIFAEEALRGGKDPVKAAKTRLHQMYGAYMQGNSHKKAAQLLNLQGRGGCSKNIKSILSLHASTKERLPLYAEFYELVAAHTLPYPAADKGITILDLGCGFNPFSVPLMPPELSQNLKEYHAYDIDLRTAGLLNTFFKQTGLPQGAKCADLAVETPYETADIALMLKLLPVLEAQSPGRGFALANALNARFLVVSYPAKSLGGREKGMIKNYTAAFEAALENGALGNFRQTAKARIGSELVYILQQP